MMCVRSKRFLSMKESAVAGRPMQWPLSPVLQRS